MRNLAKNILSSVGIDVRRISSVEENRRLSWEQKQDAMWRPFLSHLAIATIVDIGANTGQFTRLIGRHCPEATVFAFEPLSECHDELLESLAGFPSSKLFRTAVGSKPATAVMNASRFSPCSSLLPGTPLLGEDYPEAAATAPVEVSVVCVDDALRAESLEGEVLVKFDVQGSEIPAIEGAIETLAKARIVVCEVCFFRRLYEGQPLFHEIYQTLRDLGFTYMGNTEQHRRKGDGRIVEADAVFERVEN